MKKKKIGRVMATFLSFIMCLSMMPIMVFAEGNVAINATNFPDDNFRAEVSKFDKDSDGVLSQAELDEVIYIDATYKNIADIKGIEHFTKLETLDLRYNQLTSVDFSQNTALDQLFLSYNQLTNVDVSKNTALTNLDLLFNQLTSVDLSQNTALGQLYLNGNQLTNVDVSKNTALGYLFLGNNQLTNVDVSKNTALEYLDLSDNQLTNVDVSKNTALKYLKLSNNQLTKVDLSNNNALRDFFADNQLYNINVDSDTLKFDLSSLPGSFDPTKASDWSYGSVSGNILTLPSSKPTRVTYKYEDRPGRNLDVMLNITYSTGQVTISFDANGGTGTMSNVTVDKGSNYTLPANGFIAPAGKQFKGWATSATGTVISDTTINVSANTTLYAIWEDITVNSHTVKFETNGGTAVSEQTVTDGEKAIKPANPTKDGYTFDGWYQNETFAQAFDFETPITADITLYAKWLKKVATPSGDTTVPNTGDNSQIGMWFALMASAGSIIALERKRKNIK